MLKKKIFGAETSRVLNEHAPHVIERAVDFITLLEGDFPRHFY